MVFLNPYIVACSARAGCGARLRVYRKIQFNTTQTASAMTPSRAGFSYQGTPFSRGMGVTPQTRPVNSGTGFGRVSRLTVTVTTKQTAKAQIATQKFCAMVDGNVTSGVIQPPLPSATV